MSQTLNSSSGNATASFLQEIQRPLLCEPVLQSKLWGGNKLKSILGKAGGDNIGESWELSDNDTAQSKIRLRNGELRSFRTIFQSYKKEILGIHDTPGSDRFPLLLKYIDAQDDLSVQVHPGEDSELGDAKTEAWYIVDAPPEAFIIVGLSSHEPTEKILAQLQTSEAVQVLNRIPVKSGDVLFIPPGTVHSITKGLLVYEIQQNSDTTFRLYDWDRLDKLGRPRDLHLSEAARCIDYTVHDHHKITPLSVSYGPFTSSYLVACRYFMMERWHTFIEAATVPLNNRLMIFTCLQGAAEISACQMSVTCKTGDTILIPAICPEVQIMPHSDDLNIITSRIPESKAQFTRPLSAAGYNDHEIYQLGGNGGMLW